LESRKPRREAEKSNDRKTFLEYGFEEVNSDLFQGTGDGRSLTAMTYM
jgi:hypothetical protein